MTEYLGQQQELNELNKILQSLLQINELEGRCFESSYVYYNVFWNTNVIKEL